MNKPTPWSQVTAAQLRNVRGICLDIDETLSTRGKLLPEAFSALWSLKRAGFAVVPITGRPAGWCDHIARFWPVDAVVGENGAFTYFMRQGVRSKLETPSGGTGASPEALGGAQLKLEELGQKIRARFPKASWASDQKFREFDLAIDICEDVPAWPKAEVEELLALCAKEGAHAKLSSIHVNAWFGDYDKRAGFKHWLDSGAPGLEIKGGAQGGVPAWNQWLFIGDSPNDEPLFASFEYSVGVANISAYLDRLKNPPRWVTPSESGQGFAEMAARLVDAGR